MIYFIIIYGTYGITYSKGPGGQFPCPGCRGFQAYRWRRVRRFFHFFFVPLIPLNLAGEYVECIGCGQTYRMEILQAMPAMGEGGRSEAEVHRAARRLLVLMMLADGRIDEAEIETIIRILSQAENRQVMRDEVIAEIDAARREPGDVEDYCRAVMGFLNEGGRRHVLQSAQQVAGADGTVDPSEQRLLGRIGIALGMRPGEVSSSLSQPGMRATPQGPPQPGMSAAAQGPPASASPFCPRCGAPASWLADHGRWGCDHCREFLPS